MKKKIIPLLLCGLTLLTACSGKPEGMDEETYDLGKKALDIMEDYCDAEISADETYERLDIVYERLQTLELEEASMESAKNLAISLDITKLKVAVATAEDINECIADLEEDLKK